MVYLCITNMSNTKTTTNYFHTEYQMKEMPNGQLRLTGV